MKKLLLSSAAVCGLALAATPAMAQDSAIDVTVGGFVKGYAAFVDQDETANNSVRDVDIIRHTELHMGGETTLDNGLTVGVHFETEADDGDALAVEESYIYMSGDWGRVNAGAEDGAAYLLQVAAPSADSNIDGIRSFVQPVNGTALGAGGNLVLDYEQDVSGFDDKLTYISPVLGGFQGAVSYTPEVDGTSVDFAGSTTDDDAGNFGDVFEVSGRFEGEMDNIGFTVGAGYTKAELEAVAVTGGTDANDDRSAWNVGVDMDMGPFGIGVVYKEDDFGEGEFDDEEVMVVGADYTTGPFKLGASYYDVENLAGATNVDASRYAAGVVYTYGPGMTFRGSVNFVDFDPAAGNDVDATSVVLGTQINF